VTKGRRSENGTSSADETRNVKAILHYFYQNNTHSGSHCRYNLKYHLVWCPKYRRSFLTGKIAARLRQILSEIARDYRFRIIAMEVMPDHIHMLVEVPPKYAPAKVVQIFKGNSSRRLRQEFLDIIRRYIWKEGTLSGGRLLRRQRRRWCDDRVDSGVHQQSKGGSRESGDGIRHHARETVRMIGKSSAGFLDVVRREASAKGCRTMTMT